MTLPATDSFTGSNGQLTAYSGNWTLNDGDFEVVSNTLSPDDGSECAARWSLDTWTADQYSELAWLQVPTTYAGIGPALRISTTGAATYYFWYADPTDEYYGRFNTGTYTQFSSRSRAVAANGVMRLEAEGTAIRAYLNSVLQFSGPQTDSSIAAGAGGLSGYGTPVGGARGDNWGGGLLGGSGGGATSLVARNRLRRLLHEVIR